MAGSFTRSVGSFALLVLLNAGGAAPADDVVTGAAAEIVRLDVVVTDREGRLVPDLGPEDFVVTEDGKPQRVTQFAKVGKGHVLGATAAATPAPKAPAEVPGDASESNAGQGRYVVVIVDDLHIAPANLESTKDALRRFVDEFVSDDDNVALITTSSLAILQELTQDRAGLKQAINRLNFREATLVPTRNSALTAAQAELILRGDVSALKLAARTMIQEPGSKYDPSSPIANALNRSAPASAGLERDETAPAEEAKRQARSVLNEALRHSVASLGTVDSVLRGLAPLPGRKLCVLVSDGFLVGAGTSEERTRELRSVIDAATRSGTVIYALDSHGLTSSGRDASVAVSSATGMEGMQYGVDRQSLQLFRGTLESLSKDTGGFLVQGTNDLAGGLRRMLADNDTYYLVAYEPSNKKHDGKFRKISARVAGHADFGVRTRTGYLAPDERKSASAPAPVRLRKNVQAPRGLAVPELRTILATPIPSDGIPVRLSADYLELPGKGPEAVVRAHVDTRRLKWQEVAGRHQAVVDLVGGVYDKDGNAVGEPFGRHAELDLTADAYKRVQEEGLQYQQEMPLGPGRYQVRLVARESKLGQVGGVAGWVEIPDLTDKKLMISGVFLSGADPGAQGTLPAGGSGETFRDAQTLRRFKRGESLYFQLYVYNPAVDGAGASDVVLQAQIRSGSKVLAASKLQPVAPKSKDGVPVPETNGMSLQGLEPGNYELRVVVIDRKANISVLRNVDFTVE